MMVDKSRWYRLALSTLLLCTIVWLWSSRFDELLYHTWPTRDLKDLGDAITFNEKGDHVFANSYVMVSGILGNKAATVSGMRAGTFRFGRFQIRHLLGSKLYLEYDQAKYHSKFNPFTRVTVKGRLVPFGASLQLKKVRDFFKDYYHHEVDKNAMLIVVDEKPRSEIIYGLLFILSLGLVLFSFYASFLSFKRGREKYS
jgi:hypothetical protein